MDTKAKVTVRGQSPFFVFMREQRKKSPKSTGKQLGQLWRGLSVSEKHKYFVLAEKDKVRARKEEIKDYVLEFGKDRAREYYGDKCMDEYLLLCKPDLKPDTTDLKPESESTDSKPDN